MEYLEDAFTIQEKCDIHGKLLLKFGASWCPNSGLADQLILGAWPAKYPMLDIDIEEHPELVNMYRVTTIPCVLLLDTNALEIKRAEKENLDEKILEIMGAK